ncbi:MAG: ABC-F family ATP-binding cassette domain-containing protein [Spirochaetales bacterium]|nr:ABC-F family ATP-binding cassette domain-containing protein [Spirochaetales bacterium]
MNSIVLTNLTKHFGTQVILDNVTFNFKANVKYGLIGPNGSGKTTLVKLILGLEEPNQGSCITNGNTKTGYVPQHLTLDLDNSVEQFLLEDYYQWQDTFSAFEEQISSASGKKLDELLRDYQKKRDEFEAMDGDSLPVRCKSLLESSGLNKSGEERLGGLSGGERNVLSLLKAMLSRPGLLVLDEPGNHLDYLGLAWLEEFLKRYSGCLLLISHNRYLLDAVCTKTLELCNGRLAEYTGNYSEFRIARLRDAVNSQAYSIAYEKKITQIEDLVRKFRERAASTADPKWGKRLKAMKKRYDRVMEEAPVKVELNRNRIKAAFSESTARSDLALKVRNYSKAYGGLVLFENTGFEILTGDKVALVGPNGCGKTSLLRDIMNSRDQDDSEIWTGPSLKIGYCSQQAETLNPLNTVMEEMELHGLSRDKAFSLLNRFLFKWDDLGKKISGLSGGEKNRLQLAILTHLSCDFLICDEPTNHLDIPAQEVIEDALAAFNGTVLIVSHDRYLLSRIANRVIEVSGRKIVSHAGDFTDYLQTIGTRKCQSSGDIKKRRKERTRKINPTMEDDLNTVAEKIDHLERKKRDLENKIQQAYAQKDHRQGKALTVKLAGLNKLIDNLYMEWEKRVSGKK